MPLSKTEIANQALGYLGTGQQIQNLDTDQTAEARAARRFYTSTLESLLEDYSWNWSTVWAVLEIVQIKPNREWLYSYRVPNDCLFFQRIWNGSHVDDEKSVVRYVMSNDASGPLILTNWGPGFSCTTTNGVTTYTVTDTCWQTLVQYTQRNPNAEAQMPPLFRDGFALTLASNMAPMLPGIGSVDLRQKCLQEAALKLGRAIARDANQTKPPIELVSTLQKARNSGGFGIVRFDNWRAIPAEDYPI